MAEAVALLDEEGAGRLTMRRLAERLDTGSTTLYWHVKTKDDVLELALDSIFGDVALPHGDQDWRAAVVALMSGWRRAMLDHPWSAAVLGARLATAAYAVANYVIGSALMEVGAQDSTPSAAVEHLARSRDLYPALAEHGHLDDGDWDAAFVQGLDYLLDGIGGVTSP